jgi:hypothetical protein
LIDNLQRIQIKILADAPPGLSLEPFLEIFGRWRHEKDDPAQWVDLADYAHMSRGPGVVLIGHRISIGFDTDAPQPGIIFTARKGLSGSHGEKIFAAFRRCLELAKRLTEEKTFPANVRLHTGEIELRFNDRLATPNAASTDAELRPAVTQVLNTLFGSGAYTLAPEQDPAECYGFRVTASKSETLDALLGRIAQTAQA